MPNQYPHSPFVLEIGTVECASTVNLCNLLNLRRDSTSSALSVALRINVSMLVRLKERHAKASSLKSTPIRLNFRTLVRLTLFPYQRLAITGSICIDAAKAT